ncbi:MAG: hypothetical protein NC828_05930 [Candidatus Omnitrophica bacterium]|nr:hypothetical protein [Candidatus Omnitrophota bacterium]
MEEIPPSLLFSVMCDDVRREENGKFILIGLFEAIGATNFPVMHPTLYIMNCWCSGLGTFKQKTRIVNKDGATLAEDRETVFSLKDLKSKYRVIARFNNLRFERPDEYAVEIMLNNDLKIRYPLLVEKIVR